jgi:hypothetical protein
MHGMNNVKTRNFIFFILIESLKAIISFVRSVRPSLCNNWASTGRILMKCDIWVFFENMLRKFKFN